MAGREIALLLVIGMLIGLPGAVAEENPVDALVSETVCDIVEEASLGIEDCESAIKGLQACLISGSFTINDLNVGLLAGEEDQVRIDIPISVDPGRPLPLAFEIEYASHLLTVHEVKYVGSPLCTIL